MGSGAGLAPNFMLGILTLGGYSLREHCSESKTSRGG